MSKAGHCVYTLCEKCNNTTGGWYGRHFVEWCRQGMEFLDKTGGKGSVLHFGRLRPLPVIKQVTTMFLALNGRGGSGLWERPLVRFVMNKEAQYLDPRYRFWVYYVAPGPLRNTPFCSRAGHAERADRDGHGVLVPALRLRADAGLGARR